MVQYKFLLTALAAVLSLFVAAEVFAQSDAIGKRQKLMKSNIASAKAIKAAAAEKDYATIEAKAKDIMGNMENVADLFPKGSTSDKSRALPAIWDKWDEFSKNARAVRTAAKDVADAAASKNAPAVAAKLKALGGACGACHKAFRAEKK